MLAPARSYGMTWTVTRKLSIAPQCILPGAACAVGVGGIRGPQGLREEVMTATPWRIATK